MAGPAGAFHDQSRRPPYGAPRHGGSLQTMNLTVKEQDVNTLFGIHDENLRLIEDAFKVRVTARGPEIFVQGEPSDVTAAEKVLTELQELLERGYPLRKADVQTMVRVLKETPDANLVDFFTDQTLQSSLRK